MCVAADIFTQKFGYQRADFYTGVTNAQKSLNQFDRAIYYPTNWRENGVEPQRAKFPSFVRYGALVSISPEYFQRNYLGIMPLGQQPLVNDPVPYAVNRVS